jgi:hypothetical protein
LLVVDNHGCPDTKQVVEGWVHGAMYLLATEVRGTAAAKERVYNPMHGFYLANLDDKRSVPYLN